MEISRNENTLIIDNNLYKAKEILFPELTQQYTKLCNLCDLYNKECKKAPCLKSERLDNREIVFKFIKKIR